MTTPTTPASPSAEDAVGWGRPVRTLRGRGDGWSLRIDLRLLVLCAVLVAVCVGLALVSLATGDFPVTVGEVIDALRGRAGRAATTAVVGWRLPRVLLAITFGAALGLSGAVFQSLTRNPLGSPDVIGFNTGAYTGALLVMLLGADTGPVAHSVTGVATGALAGGLATAAAVYLLAYKRGVQGFRLIIVGIAVSAMLGSVNVWLMVKAELTTAMAAAAWGAGSLNGLGWRHARPSVAVIVVLAVLLAGLARGMHALEIGDDAAAAQGVRAERVRAGLVLVGVALTAVTAAVAGPIAFVALAAPQLARRAARSAGTTLTGAAAMGAALLLASDWVAQRLLAPTQLPVGVVTVSIGGLYLAWLLVHEARKR